MDFFLSSAATGDAAALPFVIVPSKDSLENVVCSRISLRLSWNLGTPKAVARVACLKLQRAK